MAFYKHHVFFCLNRREAPEACCACHNSEAMKDYAKKRVKELKLNGPGKVRINAAGCTAVVIHWSSAETSGQASVAVGLTSTGPIAAATPGSRGGPSGTCPSTASVAGLEVV